jgi:hypothetical protein
MVTFEMGDTEGFAREPSGIRVRRCQLYIVKQKTANSMKMKLAIKKYFGFRIAVDCQSAMIMRKVISQ